MTREKLIPENFSPFELGYCLGKTNLLIDQIDQGAADLRAIAEESGSQYFRPSRISYLTDMGRSRRGRMISFRLRGRLEDYLKSIDHPDFKMEAMSMPRIKDWDPLPPKKFSRIITNLQLLSQAKDLTEIREELKTLRRHMIFYYQQKENIKKQEELERKLEEVALKFRDRAGKKRGNRQ